jgi:hypothetical protein
MLKIQRLHPEEGNRLRQIRLASLIDAPDACTRWHGRRDGKNGTGNRQTRRSIHFIDVGRS